MPVEHMVWVKFRQGVTQEKMDEHLSNLRGLMGKAPAIRQIRIGRNFTDRAQGCTHGFIVTVDDRAELKAYLEHPLHVQVAAPLKQDAELMAMDIEW